MEFPRERKRVVFCSAFVGGVAAAAVVVAWSVENWVITN